MKLNEWRFEDIVIGTFLESSDYQRIGVILGKYNCPAQGHMIHTRFYNRATGQGIRIYFEAHSHCGYKVIAGR